MSEHAGRKASRFSVVDIGVDVFLLASIATVPITFDPAILVPTSESFVSQLLHLGVAFLGYFGLSLYVSQVYCAKALTSGKRRPHKVLYLTGGLAVFSLLMVVTVLFSAYNLFLFLSLPLFAGLLLVAQSAIFGFSLGLDYGIERRRAEDPRYTPSTANPFSDSLANLPYLIATVLIVFPTEYLMGKMDIALGPKILAVAVAFVLSVLLAHRADRLFVRRLHIGPNMNAPTVAVVSTLMVVGFIGVDALQIVAENQTEIGASGLGRIVLLFFFGVVPVRVGMIIFSQGNLLNRIVGALAVLAFLVVQSGVVQMPTVF